MKFKFKFKFILIFFIIILVILTPKIWYYVVFKSYILIPKPPLVKELKSTNNSYLAKVYRSDDDGSLRVDILDLKSNKEKLIYWSWKESEVNIYWVDDNVILINGRKLDVKKDVYDKRNARERT